MKEKILKKPVLFFWTIFFLTNFLGIISCILIGFFNSYNFSFLYGDILFFIFAILFFLIDHLFIKKEINKISYFFMNFMKWIFIFLPLTITLFLYLNKIYQINVLGLLIGSIIFFINILINNIIKYLCVKNLDKKND